MTNCVKLLYAVDTNTNVFPSEHAIGSVAVWVAAIHTRSLRTPLRITLITLLAMFTCFSTVFLKQHSVIDIFAAIPVCMVAYYFSFGRKEREHQ